jgi:polysaccharide deacetylase family protein (PEP-CTERM system associated)
MILERPDLGQASHHSQGDRDGSEGKYAAPSGIVNAMTVDVEDYFQVEAFSGIIDRNDWEYLPSRVERNTNRLLDLFDATGVVGTFFVLGWVAKHYPSLVRRIVADGHELASHGTDHCRADRQSMEQFRADVEGSKALLEDVGSVSVIGYRAPTFSVGRKNRWAHVVLAEAGFRYSSSVYPVVHDLYGEPGAPCYAFRPQPDLIEVPLTTIRFLGRNFPAAGGGYFRLLPYSISRWALRKANCGNTTSCVFYTHPWEIDPDQPRQTAAPLLSRVRHYLNLGLTEKRLQQLLRDFAWGRMDRIFLDNVNTHIPLIKAWPDYHLS